MLSMGPLVAQAVQPVEVVEAVEVGSVDPLLLVDPQTRLLRPALGADEVEVVEVAGHDHRSEWALDHPRPPGSRCLDLRPMMATPC